MRKILMLLMLSCLTCTYPQIRDSVLTEKDSLPIPGVLNDSVIISDSAAVQDTSVFLDSSKIIAVADTLYPVKQAVLFTGGSFLSRDKLKFIYSGYDGSFLQESPKVFVRSYSFTGYPDDIVFYGSPDISFLHDGLEFRTGKSFYDGSNILVESVDSIELVPAVRGFLYGQSFRHNTINYLSNDFLSEAPYSRIKYYEGPEGEAMLNGLFNSLIFRDLNIYADITNRTTDGRYFNSDLSSWQGIIKAKYFYSDQYNISGSYAFNHSTMGYNGGINVDSILSFTNSVNEYLYDELLAPVAYRTRELEEKQHFFRLRLLALPLKSAFTDLNLYYHYSESRIFANEDFNALNYFAKNKSAGVNISQRLKYKSAELKITGVYEKANYLQNKYITLPEEINSDIFSLSLSGSLPLLDSLLTPSVFYRFYKETYNDFSYNGSGADLILRISDHLNLYTGLSVIASPRQSAKNYSTGELKIRYSGGPINFEGGYFTRRYFPVVNVFRLNQLPGSESPNIYDVNHSGITGTADIGIWSILLSGDVAYTFDSDIENIYGIPSLKGSAGLFFNDYLFSRNLYLKSGFVFRYWEEQLLSDNSIAVEFSEGYIPEAYRVDFTLSGEIQETVILYFFWENITGNQYYLAQYYPMPFTGIRFGLSWELFN